MPGYHRGVSKATYPRDSFDDLPAGSGRVGAHRAENPRLRRGLVFLWSAVAVVVLVAVGIFSTLAVSGRLTPSAPVATTTRAVTPTPTVTPVLDTSYSVLILNATGKAGLATATKAELVRAGWQPDLVSPGDAGSIYPTTTVYYAVATDASAAAGLAKLVHAEAIVASDKYQPAGDPEAKQLTLVLGTGRIATPSPTATR